ncbi:uncharacterized protein [Coffea arabica]|uniref:Reverse transcriptase/retrotransposon-derived protein RNase H-like domain-containing protein n=1 Tax=Coffea arabica TaxID=13443 RepID=A0ABM4W326_COFAR
MDSSKIDSILTWPTPKSVKDLRGFLGLTGYYRRFIKNYGILCKPLTDLLRKDSFVWTDTARQAFDQLKKVMTSAPILKLPDFKQPFVVETDASGGGIGAILMQEDHPIAFLSKSLSPRNLGLSAYEKELLALILLEPEYPDQYQLSDGILRYKGKLYVGSSNGVGEQIMEALHSSSIRGHSGQRVYKLHGLPETIVTDRDKIFTSNFWKELFRLIGVSLCYSSAYHPETDATQALQERIRISTSIKEHLLKAQQRTKYFVDRHRTKRSFEVRDLVFLKLQPCRQQTIAIRRNLKLAAKFYGPFEVEEKIGEVAYKLKLPPTARIHPMFHMFLLKKRIGSPQQASTTLPEFDLQDQCPLMPEML